MNPQIRRRAGLMLAANAAVTALASLPAASVAHAQSAESYPARPITLVVTWPVGGFADLLGRTLGLQLGQALGQTVVVDNQGGANGVIGAATVAKALRQVVGSAALRDKLADEEAEPLAVLAAADNLAFFNKERARLSKIARDNAIKVE